MKKLSIILFGIIFWTGILNADTNIPIKTKTTEINTTIQKNLKEAGKRIGKKLQVKTLKKENSNLKKLVNSKGDYNKGFKYYKKYLKKYLGRSTKFLKKAGIDTKEKLAQFLLPLYTNNIKSFINELKDKNFKIKKRLIKNLKKISRKKEKIVDIYQFLIGIMNGKIPAGC